MTSSRGRVRGIPPGLASRVGELAEADLSGHHHPHDHTEPPSDLALRVQALQSLLVEKGLVDPQAIDLLVDAYETRIGPRNGARVVARAWGRPITCTGSTPWSPFVSRRGW